MRLEVQEADFMEQTRLDERKLAVAGFGKSGIIGIRREAGEDVWQIK